jgi:GAF domain-containing protein
MTEQDWTPAPDPNPTGFTKAVDEVLNLTAHLARELVGSHQGAAALIVKDNWKDVRKYFSLSPKYAAWDTYRAPAVGFGIHATVVDANTSIRLTQAELERHPDWRGFGSEAANHPPMRGWLAVPIVGRDGKNYGLLQLSDKYDDADYTEEDEARLKQLAQLTSMALDALWHQYHHSTAQQLFPGSA